MTDKKTMSGKLSDQELEMDLDLLEKRAAVERAVPRKKSKQTMRETAARMLQDALPKRKEETQDAPKAKNGSAKDAVEKKKTTRKKAASKKEKTQPQSEPEKRQKRSPKRAEKSQPAPGQPVAQTAAAKSPGKKSSAKKKGGRTKEQHRPPVRITPLGGMMEVGKNMTSYECQGDMFIVDCGMTFPDDDMLGVDLVLPDFTYAIRQKESLRGIVITHGHEDHIGALPYFLKEVDVPVYATKLTIGLIENKLKEHGLYGKTKLVQIAPQETIKLGCFEIEFIRVNHSIPDAVALAIHSPAGVIIHTGDFKIDYTPIMGGIIDLARFGELGSHGVLALLSDSTNAEVPGFTPTEQKVRESFSKLFEQARRRRVIVATFSSNVHRIQLICEAAAKFKRKVAVSGRSMENVVATAIELGYLQPPPNVMINIDEINRYPAEQIVILTTGSQGEPMSALSRMANCDHRKVSVTPNDFIIISARPIPGNEKTVGKVVNDLMRLGAEVIWEKMYEVHVSGHACQEELKIMLALTRPQYFLPVHGEFKQLKKHANLALAMGMDDSHVIIGDNGKVIELDGVTAKCEEMVPAGRVLVDGLGVGDVGSIVLRDRRHLGQDGLIIVVTSIEQATGEILAGPDIISRGFVYVREAEDMLSQARDIARSTLEDCRRKNMREWGNIKNQVRDALSSYFYSRTKRSPMILPVIQEI